MYRRSLLSLVFLVGLFGASSAFSHGNHSHKPVTEAKAKDLAKSAVKKLVGGGKVDATWTSKEPVLTQKKFSEETEWVATFENPASKDAAKKTLYVFLSLSGEFLGANHTGN